MSFPQLVADYRDTKAWRRSSSRAINVEKFARGVFLFALGFNKKVLIANNVAPVVDAVFAPMRRAPRVVDRHAELCGANLAFDFSGYSDAGDRSRLFFGFDFPHNFDSPYQARSITEFWRRWHISLDVAA